MLTHRSAQGGYNYYAEDDPYSDYDDGYDQDGYRDSRDNGYYYEDEDDGYRDVDPDDDLPDPDEMSARKARRRRIWRRVRRTCYVAAALMILAPLGIATYGYFTWDVPDPEKIAQTTEQVITINYSGGEEMAKISPEERRTMISSLDEVSKHMQNATLAAEDASFYSNPGFSLKGILVAAKNQVTGGIGGGSTLTQQYLKLELEKDAPTVTRKFKEIVLAYKMTNQESKQEILTAYFNTAYYGRGAYGIHAAAEDYFGKTPDKLNPSESAVLAGVVQSPLFNDPGYDKENGQQRWDYVAGQMRDNGFVTPEQFAKMEMPDTRPRNDWRGSGAGGAKFHIQQQVMDELEKQGYDEQTLAWGGYEITTTIDKRAQEAAERAVLETTGGHPELKTSLVAVDPKTGNVKAYYGGSNEGAGYDYANAPQNPGSSFKPFVALAGLEQNKGLGETYNGSPNQMIRGTEFTNSEGVECDVPKQCDVRQAMTRSVNTVFVNMAVEFGPASVAEAAHEAGIAKKDDQGQPTLQEQGGNVHAGIALGQYPVKPVGMATAYGSFVNNGVRIQPHFVAKVSSSENTEKFTRSAKEPAFSMEDGTENLEDSKKIAGNVVQSLLEVAEFSKIPLDGDRPVASKTGTHQYEDTGENRNAWMVGATPQLSTAVAMLSEDAEGSNQALYNPDGSDMYGADLPGEIWQQFMNEYHQGLPVIPFPKPEEIGRYDEPVIQTSTSSKPPKTSSDFPTVPSYPTDSETSESEESETSETTTSDTCSLWDCDSEEESPGVGEGENAIGPTTRPRYGG